MEEREYFTCSIRQPFIVKKKSKAIAKSTDTYELECADTASSAGHGLVHLLLHHVQCAGRLLARMTSVTDAALPGTLIFSSISECSADLT